VGYLGAGEDPIGRFAAELIQVGAQPVRVQSREDAVKMVQNLFERCAFRRAVCNEARIMDELRVIEALRERGVEVTTLDELARLDELERRDRLFAADLGVAAPDWAIAETGSLVYAAGPTQTRSASLLPLVHLAVVDVRCILPDLMDLPARLEDRAVDGVLARNVALVTGPSKTGDIELKLTTGVHGPGEVHVLIWEPK
jgi:L-lactate utilization protein LutC